MTRRGKGGSCRAESGARSPSAITNHGLDFVAHSSPPQSRSGASRALECSLGRLLASPPAPPWFILPPPVPPSRLAPLSVLPILLAASATLWLSACASVPPGRLVVDSVRVRGQGGVSEGDVEEKLATARSPKFLGLFSGVAFDYELFDPHVLERDLARVERFYQARGYYEAKARAGRVEQRGDGVSITILVDEGPLVRLGHITPRGLDELPIRDTAAVLSRLHELLPEGDAFDEDDFTAAEVAIRRTLTERGYAYATVQGEAEVDLVRQIADISFDIRPGKRARFGPITIEGLGDLPEEPVRRALALREGARYSSAQLDSAQRAALDLGVFSAVEAQPDLSQPGAEIVPVKVSVVPTKLRTLRLGGGTELDVIRTDVHLNLGWEHRNFLGGMRRFSVDLKPGIVFYPTKLPDLALPTRYLPESKARIELRQPGFLEPRTAGVLRGEANIYPVLLSPQYDEDAPILGYRELKGALGVDRMFARGKVYASLFYNLQTSYPFTYRGVLDSSLSSVVISYLDLRTHLDLRDNAIHPHEGIFLGNDLQVAGGFLGGDTRDIRIQPEARAYVPISRDVTFAVRGTTGLLFPSSYGGSLGDTVPDPRDAQLVYFRAFFSGGPSSNRGYPFRGIGPHGIVPFFHPGIALHQLATQCSDRSLPNYDVVCAQPLGGMTLWEASAEVRYDVGRALSVVTFCDASDVSTGRATFRFDRPHLSCGLGFRYDTPVGPLRFDMGYRIPGMQVLDGGKGRTEGSPPSLFGLPMAISIGIGEAF